jgi:hypothetical protein
MAAVVDGCPKAGDKLAAASSGQEYQAVQLLLHDSTYK